MLGVFFCSRRNQLIQLFRSEQNGITGHLAFFSFFMPVWGDEPHFDYYISDELKPTTSYLLLNLVLLYISNNDNNA